MDAAQGPPAGAEGAALAFARACSAVAVDFVFVGLVAVSAWGGRPRVGAPMESLVGLDPGRVTAWVEALAAEGLDVEPGALGRAVETGAAVAVTDPRSGARVEAKPAVTPQDRAELREAEALPFADGELRVPPPEDVIVLSLLQDTPEALEEAQSILRKQQGRLDTSRLYALSRQLGAKAALEEVMEATGTKGLSEFPDGR